MGQLFPHPKSAKIQSTFTNDEIDAIRRQNVLYNRFDLFDSGIEADYYPFDDHLDVDYGFARPLICQSGTELIKEIGGYAVYQSADQDQVDFAKPKFSNQTIIEKFPQTKIATNEKFLIDFLKANDFNNRNCLQLYLTNNHWIHSHFPQDEIIDYTGTILTNDSIKGLQHTFVRHWDQWVEHILCLEPIMERLKSIKIDLENIKNAKNRNSSYNAVNQLVLSLSKLKNDDLLDIKCALLKAQFEIFKFLKINLTSNCFRSNDQVKGKLFFDVQDLDGNKRVMVVCVSRELFPVAEEFCDPRQVRLIITIYFLTEQEYLDL